jgi:hypothetical protein
MQKSKKQWNAGFLEVVKYLQWVSNIVVARKTIFHLPRIEMLVHNAARSSTYFDGFPGYNQIKRRQHHREPLLEGHAIWVEEC